MQSFVRTILRAAYLHREILPLAFVAGIDPNQDSSAQNDGAVNSGQKLSGQFTVPQAQHRD